jgi:hypothetical protein
MQLLTDSSQCTQRAYMFMFIGCIYTWNACAYMSSRLASADMSGRLSHASIICGMQLAHNKKLTNQDRTKQPPYTPKSPRILKKSITKTPNVSPWVCLIFP